MVQISVHGSASRFLPAERGTIEVAIALEHEDRATAMQQVAGLHERFVADAKSFVHAGAATWWGSDQVRARAERRYVKDSDAHRTVQVASAEVRVKFRDFPALSEWFEHAGAVPGVAIGGIEWTLTEEHRSQEERDVRVQAVADAVQRAEAYAEAIGGTGVTLQQLWEPGLRPHSGGAVEGAYVTAMAVAGSRSSIELRPDDIEISAAVTADFLVTGLG
ncbi:SIMPL domain-containing protein [Amnibacterium sp.]|uniref:SIMPL domain-containing protein n=1 Tax=Amnibacterium sp. TaxID=1872496 RepID=UPI002606128B|nr:SIMPL domain-containing protein [Amnibacterium sp.]MCU1473513.1 hypothetical protein [Amnibacterium sp.]